MSRCHLQKQRQLPAAAARLRQGKEEKEEEMKEKEAQGPLSPPGVPTPVAATVSPPAGTQQPRSPLTPRHLPAASRAGPGGAAGAWLTGMKGTVKLNSVAEEEKRRLVPPPAPGFAAAMAAPRPRPFPAAARPLPPASARL